MKNITPTTPLLLDSNEYIFGLSETKDSCRQLINQIDKLRIFVPIMVIQEVQRNLKPMQLGSLFFWLIQTQPNISIIWAWPPDNLVQHYRQAGFAIEDAIIAASADHLKVTYIISENRHFLRQASALPFQVINAEMALKRLLIAE